MTHVTSSVKFKFDKFFFTHDDLWHVNVTEKPSHCQCLVPYLSLPSTLFIINPHGEYYCPQTPPYIYCHFHSLTPNLPKTQIPSSSPATMNPPQRPTTPKKELQLQGPRPAPLNLSKDSIKIKKPPPHPLRHNPPPPQQHFHHPVVIYTVSPKVIHSSVNEFMSLVQRLTGPSSSPPGDLSPAARLASIEKTSPSSSDHHQKHFPPLNPITSTIDDDFIDSIMDNIDLMSQFPGILSPAPATMPPIPAGFFPPAAEDSQNLNWQGVPSSSNLNSGFNSFMASPSSLFSAPLVSPSPSSWDFFHNFLGS